MWFVVGLDPIGAFVRRHPRRKRGQCFIRRVQLPQDDANVGARETIVDDRDGGRIPSRCNSRNDALLERNQLGISEPPQHLLKRLVAAQVECSRVPRPVCHGVRRIKVGARNPTDGNRLRRRMGAPMLQQLGKHVCVGPFRTLAGGRRDRLKDLDPSEPARKYPVWAAGENDAHRRIARLEQRPASVRQQLRGDLRIDLQKNCGTGA